MTIDADLFESAPSFLPVLMPEETLYSWCARYHRLSGYHLPAQTSRALFGSSTAGFMQDFPSHLSTFVSRTQGRFGDVEALAFEHTLLGFYAAFKPAGVIQSSLDAMAGGSVDRLKFHLGLPSSRLGASHPLKVCLACLQEDQNRLDFSYWHLEHQWPAVCICRKHDQLLWWSVAKSKVLNYLQWLLPGEIESRYWQVPIRPSGQGWVILRRMADFASNLQRMSDCHMDPSILRFSYLAGAKRMGWLAPSGFVRLRELRQHFLSQTQGLESLPGFEFIASVDREDGGFLGALLRSVRGQKHPVKHLVLMAFLFEKWADFWNVYTTMQALPGPSGSYFEEYDPRRAQLKELVTSEGQTVSEAARRLGLDWKKAMYWARKDDLPYLRRPRAICQEMLPVLEKALLSGQGCEEVAKCVGAPRDAVVRFLDGHAFIKAAWSEARWRHKRDAYRARLHEVLAMYPSGSATFLRTLPGSGYKWLHRHDREWLSTHLPSLWMPA